MNIIYGTILPVVVLLLITMWVVVSLFSDCAKLDDIEIVLCNDRGTANETLISLIKDMLLSPENEIEDEIKVEYEQLFCLIREGKQHRYVYSAYSWELKEIESI